MPLQSWIYFWEEGAGAGKLRAFAAILAFLALAALYDGLCYEGFSSEEAMETAQLARNVAQGRGYTTDSIRPLALSLLENAAGPSASSKVLAQPIPDLSNPPVYPCVLAGLMKVFPFQYTTHLTWDYQPEHVIGVFNQVLFFVVVAVVFFLGRALFDAKVGWLAAVLLAGTRLFWKFTLSGLSTIWLTLIFLVMVVCMIAIEKRDRDAAALGVGKSLALAVAVGLLTGIGGLTRYAFGWMIVPVILFVALSVTRWRATMCAAVAVCFLLVMGPWVARNIAVSGHLFGTAGYALAQDTPPFPHDLLERSLDPSNGLVRLGPLDVVNKLCVNGRDMLANDFPKFGGNWISAFFLVGLFVSFRNPTLTRLRWFMIGSLFLLFLVQALGRTHISDVEPEISSENMLVLLAPLVFMFGAALFLTLLDQMGLLPLDPRAAMLSTFVVVMCAPFLFGLLVPVAEKPYSPYSPLHLQQTAAMMKPDESMTSDIPGGVAWYGQRSCVWLPLDDENQFFKVNSYRALHALFLTQATTDKRYLTQMVREPRGWAHFVLECSEHGEVPSGFPLRKAPAPRGFLPDQLFLSDKIRW